MRRSTVLTVLASLAVPNISAFARDLTLTEQYINTTTKQKELIRKLYAKGKPYELSKTLIVITWKESSFGEKLSNNRGEWSGGPLGLSYYHTAIRHFKTKHPTPSQISYVEKRLKDIDDLDFSIKHAVIHLQEGIDKFDTSTPQAWMKIWAFYNGGYKHWDSEDAKNYADDFLRKIRVINKVGVL